MSLDKSFTGSLNTKKVQIFIPYNGKIADITHADTNLHTLNLAAPLGETRKIIAILTQVNRISGTGYLRQYPNEEAQYISGETGSTKFALIIIAAGTQRLQYSLSVANDDWDLFCLGYVVEA